MEKKIRCEWLMYSAMFVLSIVELKFEALSIINGNSPTLFLCLLFVAVNGDYIVKRIRIHTLELLFLACLATGVLLTIITCSGSLGIGFKTNMNGYIGFFIVYLAFRLWFVSITAERWEKTVKSLFWGYVICCGVMGILQFIYIYLGKNQILHDIFELVLNRPLENYVDAPVGRIPFWGEPSYAGSYLFLLFIPAYVLIRDRTKSSNSNRIIFVIMITLNFFTLSARFAVDVSVFILVLICCKCNLEKNGKNFVAFIILSIGILLLLMFKRQIGEFFMQTDNDMLKRVGNVMIDAGSADASSSYSDSSMSVRMEKIRCAIVGFCQKPLFGWGTGNFILSLKENIDQSTITNWNAMQELKRAIDGGYSATYCFYATSVCELGLCGAGMIVCMIKRLWITVRSNISNVYICVIAIYIGYLFLQFELAGFFIGAFWLSMFESNVKPLLESQR